jgi:hypothetical protein
VAQTNLDHGFQSKVLLGSMYELYTSLSFGRSSGKSSKRWSNRLSNPLTHSNREARDSFDRIADERSRKISASRPTTSRLDEVR